MNLVKNQNKMITIKNVLPALFRIVKVNVKFCTNKQTHNNLIISIRL